MREDELGLIEERAEQDSGASPYSVHVLTAEVRRLQARVAELECDAALGRAVRAKWHGLYITVSAEEPCQIVGVHPVRWHEHGEPTRFLREISMAALGLPDGV